MFAVDHAKTYIIYYHITTLTDVPPNQSRDAHWSW